MNTTHYKAHQELNTSPFEKMETTGRITMFHAKNRCMFTMHEGMGPELQTFYEEMNHKRMSEWVQKYYDETWVKHVVGSVVIVVETN
jgi:hypothetical protein